MAITTVVARMYDSGGMKLRSGSTSENGFDEAINKAVDEKTNNDVTEKTKNREVCVRCVHARDLNPTLVSHKISSDDNAAESTAEKSSEVESADGAAEVSEQEVNSSVAYRFSVFIRTSSDISSMGSGLIDKFRQATHGFVKALHADKSYGVNTLDSYLGQAEGAAKQGEVQTMSFVDKMLQAADNGLKAVTASMSSASVMNGFNLSMNSALPGTSAADIAGIYLQDAMQKSSMNGGSSRTSLNPGRGGGLQLIRTESLTSNSTSTSAPELVSLSPGQEAQPAVRDSIIEKFLGILDEIISGQGNFASPVRSEIHFRMDYASSDAKSIDVDSSEKIVEEMPTDDVVEPGEVMA